MNTLGTVCCPEISPRAACNSPPSSLGFHPKTILSCQIHEGIEIKASWGLYTGLGFRERAKVKRAACIQKHKNSSNPIDNDDGGDRCMPILS
jgi:hypothetical protein